MPTQPSRKPIAGVERRLDDRLVVENTPLRLFRSRTRQMPFSNAIGNAGG